MSSTHRSFPQFFGGNPGITEHGCPTKAFGTRQKISGMTRGA
jgi:hypothetical protein